MNPQENPQSDSGSIANSNLNPGPQVIGPQQSQPMQSQPPQAPQPTQAQTPSMDISPVVSQLPQSPQASVSPPSQTQAFSGGSEPIAAPKKKRPGKKILLVVSMVLLLGMGGGAFAYWQILNNSPEKVLADALSNTLKDVLDKKPIELKGTVKYESKNSRTPFTVAVDLGAKWVGENGETNVKVNVKANNTIDVTVNAAFVAEGSKAVYFKVNDLQKTIDDVMAMGSPEAKLPPVYDALIKKIDGNWIKIDQETITEVGLSSSEEELSKCTTAFDELRISDGDKGRVKEIFKNNQFAVASEELPSEDVEGESSYHYKLDLNQDAGLRFAKDFIELESFKGVKEACEIKSEDLDKAISDLKNQTDTEATSDVKPVFELWVSKSKRYPTKVKISANEKEISMESITTVNIDAQNLSVEIPTDFITYKDLQKEIEQMSSSGQSLGWSDIRQEVIQSQ